MKINLPLYDNVNDGFGNAGRGIKNSLKNAGYTVNTARTPTAARESDVVLTFSHPSGFFNSDGYDIGYFPWESTEPQPGWTKRMSIMDEIWVSSPWLQDIVEDWGFEPYVYEHGVNPLFTGYSHRTGEIDGPMRFLYMGPESHRKGSFEAVHAFRRAFGNSLDYQLVIKTQVKNMPKVFPNIKYIDHDLPVDDLVSLFFECDVFLAPTYGEGFGIPARDAMCTGMPLVATGGFLPYEDMMHDDLIIPSRMIDSPWPEIHPGKVYRPDVDILVDQLRLVAENYDYFFKDSMTTAPEMCDRYDWGKLTHRAFSALEDRL